jgi:transcriptional regulator of acetoin/glycerol metabolism
MVAAANGSVAVRSLDAGPVNPASSCPVIPLAEMEKQAILRALQYTKNDRVMAAHLLGIGRTTLYRKLKEYELDSEP